MMRLGSGVSWPQYSHSSSKQAMTASPGRKYSRMEGRGESRAWLLRSRSSHSSSSFWPFDGMRNAVQFNRGLNQFSQPRFVQRGEGSQGWEGVCRGLHLEAFGQVLFQLGDFVGLGIVFSLGPFGHLLDPVAGVPIVVDP